DERCHHRVSQGRAPLSQNRKCERFWTLPSTLDELQQFAGRGAVRVVTCGAPATARKLKSSVLPDPPPDPAASATLLSDRHCRGGNLVVSSSQGRFQSGQFARLGERRDLWAQARWPAQLAFSSLASGRVATSVGANEGSRSMRGGATPRSARTTSRPPRVRSESANGTMYASRRSRRTPASASYLS